MYKIIMTLCVIRFMYIGTYARSRFRHLILEKHLALHLIIQVDSTNSQLDGCIFELSFFAVHFVGWQFVLQGVFFRDFGMLLMSIPVKPPFGR